MAYPIITHPMKKIAISKSALFPKMKQPTGNKGKNAILKGVTVYIMAYPS